MPSNEENNIENKQNNLENPNQKIDIDFYKQSKIDNESPNWGIMLTLQSNLNYRIGTQAWKKYISAAFWNYISTPINFTITLFTALSAGQTGSKSTYLSDDQLFYILLSSFLLSIVNTFFKLKEKSVLNYEAAKQYDLFGAQFEKIYFMPLDNENHLLDKLRSYIILQDEINKYSQKESIENVNYITEIFYNCTKQLFSHKMKRLNVGERFWYLDGITPKHDRKYNNWNVNLSKYLIDDYEELQKMEQRNSQNPKVIMSEEEKSELEQKKIEANKEKEKQEEKDFRKNQEYAYKRRIQQDKEEALRLEFIKERNAFLGNIMRKKMEEEEEKRGEEML